MSNNPADLTGVMGEHTHVTHVHIQDRVPPLSISQITHMEGEGTPSRGGKLEELISNNRIDLTHTSVARVPAGEAQSQRLYIIFCTQTDSGKP